MKVRQDLSHHRPAEEIQPLVEEAAREIKEKAALPGFRPGRAPLDLIKARFGKEIRAEILEHHLPKWAGKWMRNTS